MSNKKETTWKSQLIPFRPNGTVNWQPPKKGSTHFPLKRYWDWKQKTYITIPAQEINWQPNAPFKAALKFVELFRGANDHTHAKFNKLGSSATYIMRDEHLEECLIKGVIVHGVILGEWRFMCRGGRLSVVPIDFISTIDLENSTTEQEKSKAVDKSDRDV